MTSQFSQEEIRSIIIAWIVLSFGITYTYILDFVNGMPGSLQVVIAGFIATATGFILHEMGHKYAALSFGYSAHFRIWVWGIIITFFSVVVSGGGFLFGAPGSVDVSPATAEYYPQTNKIIKKDWENMVISAAGPVINLVFALLFLVLYVMAPLNSFSEIVGSMGFSINVGLGSFNIIPIPPLDGYKIFKKNIIVGLAIALPLWAMFVYYLF